MQAANVIALEGLTINCDARHAGAQATALLISMTCTAAFVDGEPRECSDVELRGLRARANN